MEESFLIWWVSLFLQYGGQQDRRISLFLGNDSKWLGKQQADGNSVMVWATFWMKILSYWSCGKDFVIYHLLQYYWKQRCPLINKASTMTVTSLSRQCTLPYCTRYTGMTYMKEISLCCHDYQTQRITILLKNYDMFQTNKFALQNLQHKTSSSLRTCLRTSHHYPRGNL